MSTDDSEMMSFATRLFELIERSLTNSTYKYAVLLGLIELCMERSSTLDPGESTMVTTRQLAGRVLELYWPQARPCPTLPLSGVPRQNRQRQARILRRIEDFRSDHSIASLYRARHEVPGAYLRLLNDIEWALIEEPLPRLQWVGGQHDDFLYGIGWSVDDVRKRKGASGVSAYQRALAREGSDEAAPSTGDFDNRILLKPGVAHHLARLGALIRPLVQREWARLVADFNDLELARLETFLFDVEREALTHVASPLRELQDNRCFYCNTRLERAVEVDHFLAWSRCPDNGIHNLVVAHKGCNGRKADHLASADHLHHWLARGHDFADDLRDIAEHARLPEHPSRTLGIVHAAYWPLPDGTPLWRLDRDFDPADRTQLRRLLEQATHDVWGG